MSDISANLIVGKVFDSWSEAEEFLEEGDEKLIIENTIEVFSQNESDVVYVGMTVLYHDGYSEAIEIDASLLEKIENAKQILARAFGEGMEDAKAYLFANSN